MNAEKNIIEWKNLINASAPNSVVVLATENMLDGVDEAERYLFAWNFGAELNKRLRRAGYKQVRFEGDGKQPVTMEYGGKQVPTVWGSMPGVWKLRVLLQGGRWEYHSTQVLKLVRLQELETRAVFEQRKMQAKAAEVVAALKGGLITEVKP